MEPWRLTASEAAAAVASGDLTSEALVRSCLERIEDRESEVRAWVHLDPDYALEQAREADRKGGRGPLHGVPFGVKDVIDSAGLPTEYGSPAIHGGHRPDRDAACVAAMRASGAVLLGKTVSTEFATFTPGKTRNPHNPAHTPAARRAARPRRSARPMTPIAFGNQTAGSLIRPAAFCGVVGLKPTHGTVDLGGILTLEAELRHAGLHGALGRRRGGLLRIVRGAPPAPPPDRPDRTPRVGCAGPISGTGPGARAATRSRAPPTGCRTSARRSSTATCPTTSPPCRTVTA